MSLDAVLTRIDETLPAALDRLMELLRIPSISTDPAFKPECARAADWLAADLRSLGFEAATRPTPGHPMVVGHGGTGGRHLLFYGHYDVQPVDPLVLWERDPFDPEVQDTAKGKVIRGRGSSDDKGQLMTFLEACRAWIHVHGKLPGKLTIFLEGEEESGSPSLIPFLKANKAELSANIALICDTGLFQSTSPAIVTMLRGLLGEELTIRGATKDLHSGMYGGAAQNPIRVLSRILANIHDANGRITIPGFYDGVTELPDAIRQQWQNLAFDHAAFLGDVGLSVPAGEVDRTPLEMIWSRPTAEVNGIWGGYTGDGFKTVLPSEAHAKVSFRLVGAQDPFAIRAAFRAWVETQLPADCTVEFEGHGNSPAGVMAIDDPAFEATRAALGEEWGRAAAYVGCGGSIPVAGYFKTYLGMDAMLVGFGRDDDQIHSPNEKYDLECFHKGIRSWARILARLGRGGGGMLEIRDAQAADAAEWHALWQQYLAFYEVTLAPEVTARTWARILDAASPLSGRVAVVDGAMVGFALHLHHASTWVMGEDCYLEDLFLAEPARGKGVGRALIEDLMALARAKGWHRLYWHTDEGNVQARALYDRFVQSDGHIRYRMVL